MTDPSTPGVFDPTRRFIRIRRTRADGFIEFDFAMGDAGLSVELILPHAAFDVFAQLPGTETMSATSAAEADQHLQQFLYGPSDDAADIHPQEEETHP